MPSCVSLRRVFGDQIRFGVYSGPEHASFEGCLELWRRCEELGYDWLSVFDHFMPIVGDPAGPCFEGPTMMAAMRSGERRVGEEGRSRWSADHLKKRKKE